MPPPVPSEGSPVSSSRRAYDAVEVRLHIFGMLEQSTLAVLMRVEKGITASVASALYREVSEGQARRMVRDTVSHAPTLIFRLSATGLNLS